MKENVKTELETLIFMVQRWKKWGLGQMNPEETDPRFKHIKVDARYSSDTFEWIYEDFVERIVVDLLPYIDRFRECDFIDDNEIEYFMERISGEISDMRRLLGLPEPDAPRKVTPIRGE